MRELPLFSDADTLVVNGKRYAVVRRGTRTVTLQKANGDIYHLTQAAPRAEWFISEATGSSPRSLPVRSCRVVGGGTRCPDCAPPDGEKIHGQWRVGRCDDCDGSGRDENDEGCANCQGTGMPVCCRCEGTGIDPFAKPVKNRGERLGKLTADVNRLLK